MDLLTSWVSGPGYQFAGRVWWSEEMWHAPEVDREYKQDLGEFGTYEGNQFG
jgi:hypothetical protein